MSPEQLKAQPLDERSDLFSLARVLYEVLSGRPAFPGGRPESASPRSSLRDAPPSRGRDLAERPACCARALARDREGATRRPPRSSRTCARSASGEYVAALPDTLAVLDFQNLCAPRGRLDRQRHRGERRRGSRGDRRPDRGSARHGGEGPRLARFPGSAAEPVELGHALGCRWVLAGATSARRQPARHVAAHRGLDAFRRGVREARRATRRDLLDPGPARAVGGGAAAADARRRRAPARRPRRSSRPTRRTRAGGASSSGSRREAWIRPVSLYEDALRADPHHAPALGDLAAVHAMRYTFTTDAKELALARGYAERAIRADPEAGGPRIWLAYVVLAPGERRRSGRARAPGRRALAGGPVRSVLRGLRALGGAALGRVDSALPERTRRGRAARLELARARVGAARDRKARRGEVVPGEGGRARAAEGAPPDGGGCGLSGRVPPRARAISMARGRAASRRSMRWNAPTSCIAIRSAASRSARWGGPRSRETTRSPRAPRSSRRPRTSRAARTVSGRATSSCRLSPGSPGSAGSRGEPTRRHLDEALVLFRERRTHNFDWLWLCTDDDTLRDLRLAEGA